MICEVRSSNSWATRELRMIEVDFLSTQKKNRFASIIAQHKSSYVKKNYKDN